MMCPWQEIFDDDVPLRNEGGVRYQQDVAGWDAHVVKDYFGVVVQMTENTKWAENLHAFVRNERGECWVAVRKYGTPSAVRMAPTRRVARNQHHTVTFVPGTALVREAEKHKDLAFRTTCAANVPERKVLN
jgi:hypothetical protein